MGHRQLPLVVRVEDLIRLRRKIERYRKHPLAYLMKAEIDEVAENLDSVEVAWLERQWRLE